MRDFVHKIVRTLLLCAVASILPLSAVAQDITVDPPQDGDLVVAGQTTPGSGPIEVYDVSFTIPALIGRGGVIDDNGYFAIYVSPALMEGYQIKVENALGEESQSVFVGPSGS